MNVNLLYRRHRRVSFTHVAIYMVARTRIQPQMYNGNQQNAHVSDSCFNLKRVHSVGLRYIIVSQCTVQRNIKYSHNYVSESFHIQKFM
jgi:hypothetical protein